MDDLVDTHAHLDEIEDLEGAIGEARDSGVVAIVAMGSDYSSNQRVLELARLYPGLVYPALGLHPWSLKDADIGLNLGFIQEHIDEAVAVGEVGLDYHKRVRAVADKEMQAHALRELLEIARGAGKPVSLHSRYAWQDTLNVAKESRVDKVVFHWYTGTSSVLREIIERGYYISATPAVAYHTEHRRAVRETPLARLLLETDCPVVYQRDTEFELRSRPAHVRQVLGGISRLAGLAETEIARATTANARRLFGLPGAAREG